MKNLFLIFALLSVTALSQNKFKVDFDYARFNYDDSSGYLEIYYSFFPPELTLNDQKTVKGVLEIKIYPEGSDSLLIDKSYQFSNIVNPEDSLKPQSLTGNLGFNIPHGKYYVRLAGIDGNNASRFDTVSFNLDLSAYPPERYSVSDIELASSIKESENNRSLFYKNTFEVVPNAASVFGDPLAVLYFYSEIYNVNKNISSPTLKVEHILLDSRNRQFIRKSKVIPRKNNAVVEVGALNIAKAPSGTYLLVVAVTDSAAGQSVYSSKRLFIYNPNIIDTTTDFSADKDVMSSEFSSMSDEELDETFAFSKYIATSQEKDQWNKLSDASGKRNFLFNFWKGRDLNVNTPVNETKREYFQRVEKANKQFSTMQRKGWKTDRGRVLIMYGEPSEIERYPNQTDTKPYEVWQYHQVEGGVYFVFADISGFSDYVLVHSTHRNELRDDDWVRKIQTN